MHAENIVEVESDFISCRALNFINPGRIDSILINQSLKGITINEDGTMHISLEQARNLRARIEELNNGYFPGSFEDFISAFGKFISDNQHPLYSRGTFAIARLISSNNTLESFAKGDLIYMLCIERAIITGVITSLFFPEVKLYILPLTYKFGAKHFEMVMIKDNAIYQVAYNVNLKHYRLLDKNLVLNLARDELASSIRQIPELMNE